MLKGLRALKKKAKIKGDFMVVQEKTPDSRGCASINIIHFGDGQNISNKPESFKGSEVQGTYLVYCFCGT